MSKWITDRRPTGDEPVYDSNGCIALPEIIADGEPWKPIPKCEPYVKPKPWEAHWNTRFRNWSMRYADGDYMLLPHLTDYTNHADAANRIVEIYNEVLP